MSRVLLFSVGHVPGSCLCSDAGCNGGDAFIFYLWVTVFLRAPPTAHPCLSPFRVWTLDAEGLTLVILSFEPWSLRQIHCAHSYRGRAAVGLG